MTLRRGQLFRHELPGSGGWGDPLSRDLARVAQDLRDGLVTIDAAARDYGVVARGDPPEIDVVATAELRASKNLSRFAGLSSEADRQGAERPVRAIGSPRSSLMQPADPTALTLDASRLASVRCAAQPREAGEVL
jgi:hypothetical protein